MANPTGTEFPELSVTKYGNTVGVKDGCVGQSHYDVSGERPYHIIPAALTNPSCPLYPPGQEVGRANGES